MKNIQRNRQLAKWRKNGIVLPDPFYFDEGVSLDLASPFFKTAKGKLQIGSESKLSRGCVIDCYGGTVLIGKNVFFGPYCVLYGHGNITIGDNCLIAMGCKIVASNHTVPEPGKLINQQPDEPAPIVIGNDVWLGADVKVLAGVSIGDGCVIAAGSVVTKSIPPNSIAVGVPASVIRQR